MGLDEIFYRKYSVDEKIKGKTRILGTPCLRDSSRKVSP